MKTNKMKFKRSEWLPALLLAYFACMTIWFGRSLIAKGEWLRLVLVSLAELTVIYILRVFLRKREANQ